MMNQNTIQSTDTNHYHIYRKTTKRNGREYVWTYHATHVSPIVELNLDLGYRNAKRYAKQLRDDTGKQYVAVGLPAYVTAPKQCLMTIDVLDANGVN
jgi:hypothetical protein